MDKVYEKTPKLSLRISDPLSHCRSSAVSQLVLDYYFELLKKTLEVNGLMDKPNRIYNMDESGCLLTTGSRNALRLKVQRKYMGHPQVTKLRSPF